MGDIICWKPLFHLQNTRVLYVPSEEPHIQTHSNFPTSFCPPRYPSPLLFRDPSTMILTVFLISPPVISASIIALSLSVSPSQSPFFAPKSIQLLFRTSGFLGGNPRFVWLLSSKPGLLLRLRREMEAPPPYFLFWVGKVESVPTLESRPGAIWRRRGLVAGAATQKMPVFTSTAAQISTSYESQGTSWLASTRRMRTSLTIAAMMTRTLRERTAMRPIFCFLAMRRLAGGISQ